MSRPLLLLIGAGVLGLVGLLWWWLVADTYPIRNYPVAANGPILIFGDSLAEGVGATPGNALASLLGRALGEPILNYGVAGDTTALALARLETALEASPRLVIIILGGNDFLRKVPRQETFANLKTIIMAFQDRDAIVLLAGVRSGLIGGGADEEYAALAKETGAAYAEDILSGIFGHTELMSDAVHPNAAGYARIADRLLPLMRKLLEKR